MRSVWPPARGSRAPGSPCSCSGGAPQHGTEPLPAVPAAGPAAQAHGRSPQLHMRRGHVPCAVAPLLPLRRGSALGRAESHEPGQFRPRKCCSHVASKARGAAEDWEGDHRLQRSTCKDVLKWEAVGSTAWLQRIPQQGLLSSAAGSREDPDCPTAKPTWGCDAQWRTHAFLVYI